MRLHWLSILAIAFVAAAAKAETPASSCATDGGVTLQVTNVSVRVALRQIAEQADVNIAVPQHFANKVSANFSCVPAKTALSWVLSQVGATYCEEGNVLRVVRLADSRDCRAAKIRPSERVSRKGKTTTSA